jgi:RHH-type transcriptional regulator, rel operon repressor / antitoxin RelB
MAETTTLTVRLSKRSRQRLDKLAAATDRTQSELAARAIDTYVRDQADQLRRIDAGLADLDAGRVIDHRRMSSWLRSWGKKGEKPAPR